MKLLDSINSSDDLKKLPISQLKQVAAEIRETMLDAVSQHGGHLAASLGVVELTIALHYSYDTPVDKLVWDVGHQSYAHKIITGRRDTFKAMRQFGGPSGFPRTGESPYDSVSVGHASTSISTGLGLAIGRDLRREKHAVVSIIGDGSLLGRPGLRRAQQPRVPFDKHDGGFKRQQNVDFKKRGRAVAVPAQGDHRPAVQ